MLSHFMEKKTEAQRESKQLAQGHRACETEIGFYLWHWSSRVSDLKHIYFSKAGFHLEITVYECISYIIEQCHCYYFMLIFFPLDLVRPRDTYQFCVEHGELKVYKTLDTPFFSTGKLILGPLQEKGKQHVGLDTLVGILFRIFLFYYWYNSELLDLRH